MEARPALRIGILTALLAACAPPEAPAPAPAPVAASQPAPASQGERRPRTLDAQPTQSRLQSPLPPGRAEALFRLDTGGDQMTETAREAGLVVVVRVGADEYRQTIASCADPGLGSALGGGTERELEVAICNGEFYLVSEPGLVSVVPVKDGVEGKAIARFELPAGVRAVGAGD